jgi:fermentation-respiration switch protein FrsA (DUF1100 family)
LLITERYADLVDLLEPKLCARFLSQTLLCEVGRYLVQFGPLLHVGSPEEREIDGSRVFTFTLSYLSARIELTISVQPDSNISGIHLGALALPDFPWAAPRYSRRDSFHNIDISIGDGKWSVPGTLSMPSKGYDIPAVVLIAGSGPQDRDATVGRVKPFRDLAEGLASQGIAVVRYDKRTMAHQRAIALDLRGFTVEDESVRDAILAADFLRRIPNVNCKRIFLIGHSFGGYLAPRIACSDNGVAGILLLSASPRPIEQLMLEQLERHGGGSQLEAARSEVEKLKTVNDESVSSTILGLPVSYWLDLRHYSPIETLKTIRCPVFILHGARDCQVYLKDYCLWRRGLLGREKLTMRLYPELNHLLTTSERGGSTDEYLTSRHVDEEVVLDIAKWLFSQ